ncbi:hypothetical protein BGZ60DRAFT_398217 [Tricladium varicosporioides]|nr:hypothetical protein BGZ60DRAFT_398217 [Hymenoscyphus varicosporioides]
MLYYKFYKDRLFINGAPGQFLEVAELMYKADKERIRKLAVSLKEFIGGRRNFYDRTREDFAEAVTHFPYVKGVYLFVGNIINDMEVAGDHKRLVRKIKKNNEAIWRRKWGSRQQPEYFIEVVDPLLAKSWNIDNLLWAGQSNSGWEEGHLQTVIFRPIGS